MNHVWMTREEIARKLGIVVNSVRGKVQKGQIERKVVEGKNLYRIVDADTPTPPKAAKVAPLSPVQQPTPEKPPRVEPSQTKARPVKPSPIQPVREEPIHERQVEPSHERRVEPTSREADSADFNPKQVLLDQLASLKVGRSIDAIEKGDEIDLATGEISRELDAKISMRQHKQAKEIEEALERVRYGEYGMCEECGDSIPEQRLRLFPAARFCVRCQEEADHIEKLRLNQGALAGVSKDDSSDTFI